MHQWAQARTLAELGELTALWLEGVIDSHPNPFQAGGPDEETMPLIPTLAAVNRTGVVTDSSQPGQVGRAFDGQEWVQRAAVTMFVGSDDRVGAIAQAAKAAGLDVMATASRGRALRIEPVTVWGGIEHTWEGRPMDARWLDDAWRLCRAEARAALKAATQVTVLDPSWGRDDVLWPALLKGVQG